MGSFSIIPDLETKTHHEIPFSLTVDRLAAAAQGRS